MMVYPSKVFDLPAVFVHAAHSFILKYLLRTYLVSGSVLGTVVPGQHRWVQSCPYDPGEENVKWKVTAVLCGKKLAQ